jgi:hypothetical protein
VDLLPDAADAATGEHRHCEVTGHVDRHRCESPSTTQARHRFHAARLNQGHALCQDVVGHYFALALIDERSPSV